MQIVPATTTGNNQESDYLQQNQPNYQVMYKQPASYYQMPWIVTYATTENHLFIKIEIPLSTSLHCLKYLE